MIINPCGDLVHEVRADGDHVLTLVSVLQHRRKSLAELKGSAQRVISSVELGCAVVASVVTTVSGERVTEQALGRRDAPLVGDGSLLAWNGCNVSAGASIDVARPPSTWYGEENSDRV